MKLHDAIFNWLQIKVVADARPDDLSATDTVQFFWEILEEDHRVSAIRYEREQDRYTVHYTIDDEPESIAFDQEQVEQLLVAIQNEPRYNM